VRIDPTSRPAFPAKPLSSNPRQDGAHFGAGAATCGFSPAPASFHHYFIILEELEAEIREKQQEADGYPEIRPSMER
jgi:hypothetical protein